MAHDDSDVQAAREAGVTAEVIRSFDDTPSDRLREIMTALVRHLHAFAGEVRLSQDEWQTAIHYLTDTGKICTDTRQEFILLSDVLGLSMRTVAMNSSADEGATESTVFGPFFVEGSGAIERGGNLAGSVSGQPCYIRGHVCDTAGNPIAGARIEVWEADDDGFYDVQYENGPLQGRGHLFTDEQGGYDFWCVRPAAYPIPSDGPVGRLLDAAGRSPMRPAHVHFMVSAAGFQTLITHVFVADGPYLDSDAVFGVKDSLIVEFEEQAPGPTPGGATLDVPWVRAEYDFVLADLAEIGD